MARQIISRRDFLQDSGAGIASAVLLSACLGERGGDEAEAADALAAPRPDFGVSVFAFPLASIPATCRRTPRASLTGSRH